MKNKLLIVLVLGIFATLVYAVNTELQDLAENTTIVATDVFYIVDDPAGTPASEKITALNLFDMIDTSAELAAIVTDETGSAALVFANTPTLVTPVIGAATGTSAALTSFLSTGADAADAGAIRLSNAEVIAWEDATEATITHIDNTGWVVNLGWEVDGTFDADGIVTLGDGGDNFSVASDGIDIDTSGNITNAGTIASGVITVTGVINTSVGLDAVGAVDLDYGSADVTDHTFVSGGGTTIIDGSVTAVTAFIIGAASMAESDLEQLDGITPGTAAASKALVLDGSLDIATINSLTATTLVGALTGNADTVTTNANLTGEVTSAGNAATIADSVTVTGWVLGTSSATQITSPTLITDLIDTTGAADMDYGSADVTDHTFTSDGGVVVLDGSISGVTSLTIGAAALLEAELETLDGITPGTAAASKALVLDGSLDITGVNSFTSTTFVGALTGAASGNLLNSESDTLIGTLTANGLTLGANENITLGAQTLDHDGTDFVFDDSVNIGANAFTTSVNIKSEPKYWNFNIINPLATQTEDTQVGIILSTDAALTITNIKITLDAAGNEVAGDLMFADAFIGFANATVINVCDTTSGVLDDSAMADGTIPSGKTIYFQFDSAPNTAITQMLWKITYDYD